MQASWTIMVYLAGFNNLSPFALKDLDEMRKVGSTDEVRIAAFVKREGQAGARRLIIQRDGQGEAAEELGDVDSGDPQTLLDFIRWAHRVAPAQRYALVVWNHGSGWRPDDLDALYESVRADVGDTGVTPREIGLRSTQQIARSLFSPTVERVLALRTSHDRGIASDDGTGHSMDTIELDNVLTEAHRELGGPLEVLGMDACLMSNQEVAYQSADHVRYVVGSEDLEPGDGWPYTEIMRRLTAEPQMDGAGLGRVIVEEYVRSYSDGTETATQCAVDVAAMTSFTQPFEELTRALRAAVRDRTDRAEIMAAQAAAVRFQGELVDVRSFCARLLDGQVAEPVKQAARAVNAALDPVGYVVAEGHEGAAVTGVGGVTVYFPTPFDSISTYYTDLRFAKESGWDDFLSAYIDAVRNR